MSETIRFNSRRYSAERAYWHDLIVQARRLRHDLARTYIQDARAAQAAGDEFVRQRLGVGVAEHVARMVACARRARRGET